MCCARKPGPVAKLLPSAHAVEREFRVMQALAAATCRSPRMHALCEDESVIGRAFYVMEFVQGRVLWDQALPGMTPAERGAIYDEMNRVIAALHNVDVVRAWARRLRPARQLFRAADRPLEQAISSRPSPRPIASMDRLIAWLPAHMPASARDERRSPSCMAIIGWTI